MTLPTAPTPLYVLDLFAGPGGWDVGHRLAVPDGSEETRGIEWDKTACDTARAAGFTRLCRDVATLDPTRLGLFVGQLASPPCQGFSIAGKGAGREDSLRLIEAAQMMGDDPAASAEVIGQLHHDMKDDRSVLALEPLRYALALIRDGRPFQWIAWEQVPAVLPLWEVCAQVLRLHGYQAEAVMVQAEQHGVPQTRKRAVMRATLEPSGLRPLIATHSRYHSRTPSRLDPGVAKWVSMAEALSWGMTERPYVTVAAGTAAGGTDPQALGGSAARRTIATEREEGRWIEQPEDHPWRGGGRWREEEVNGQPRIADQSGTVVDLDWPDKRPATVIAGRDLVQHPGATANRFNGSTKSRNDGVRVTVQEAAVLQSFPADYPWQGTRTQQYRQVGDAVPPLLAKAIIESVRWTP